MLRKTSGRTSRVRAWTLTVGIVAGVAGAVALPFGLFTLVYNWGYESDDRLIARIDISAVENEVAGLLEAGGGAEELKRDREHLPETMWPPAIAVLSPQFVDVEDHSLWAWWGDHIGCRGFRVFDHSASSNEASGASTLDLVAPPRRVSDRVWFYKGQ